LRSLSGRVPNLKNFKTELQNVNEEILDDFFAFVPKLETLDLGFWGVLFDFSFNKTPHFWHLSALTSLVFAFKSLKINAFTNEIFGKIPQFFPNLEKLHLDYFSSENGISSDGISKFTLLKNLRDLKIYNQQFDSVDVPGDDSLKNFANCPHLSELGITQLVLPARIFIDLIRSCPTLNLLETRRVGDVATAEMAGDILESFLDIGERTLKINFYGDHLYGVETTAWYLDDIWLAKNVESVLERLKVNGGPSIDIKFCGF